MFVIIMMVDLAALFFGLNSVKGAVMHLKHDQLSILIDGTSPFYLFCFIQLIPKK